MTSTWFYSMQQDVEYNLLTHLTGISGRRCPLDGIAFSDTIANFILKPSNNEFVQNWPFLNTQNNMERKQT